jgi:thymidylate kinase
MVRIAIEGNIGAGKTTQLNLLSKLGIEVYREPVHLWPLEEFYNDPIGNAYLMQTSVLASFMDHGNGVYERSTLASREVFSQNMTTQEKIAYELLYQRIGWNPDYWIFLESDPEKCYARVTKRKFTGDSKVTLEYLQVLDEKYKRLYDLVKDRSFIVNADRPAHEVHQSIMNIIEKSISFQSEPHSYSM